MTDVLARLVRVARGKEPADLVLRGGRVVSFLALAVIPSLKLTDRGLVDVDAFALTDVFV